MKIQPLNIGDQQTVDLRDCVLLGKVVGHWGIKGWLKVFSYTRPRQDIGNYDRWLLVPSSNSNKKRPAHARKTDKVKATSVVIKNCRVQAQNIVANLEGVNYRDEAEKLFEQEIYVEKSQLKPLKKGEFYWSDMIGCTVTNTDGDVLGVVESMLETGANDVLIVHNNEGEELVEHLLPYSKDIVLEMDAQEKTMLVDWGVDFLVTEKSTEPKKPKMTKQERSEEIRLAKLEKAKQEKE